MSAAALAALTVLGGASTLIGLMVGIDRATARRQPARSDWPHVITLVIDDTSGRVIGSVHAARDCPACCVYDRTTDEGIEQAEQWANGGAA